MKILPCLLLVLAVVLASADDEIFDARRFAREITEKDLGPENWQKYLKKSRKNLDDYFESFRDTADTGSFLNDRLTDLANQVDDLASLKKFVAWLALYDVWEVPLPPRAEEKLKKREQDLKNLAKDFSWEKLLAMVKPEKKQEQVGTR